MNGRTLALRLAGILAGLGGLFFASTTQASINPWVEASLYDSRRWDTSGPEAATPWLHPQTYAPEMGWGMLDPLQAIESGDWKKMAGITGSWGGSRSKMRERGISVAAAYFGQFAANPVGGLGRGTRQDGKQHGASWRGDFSVAVFADLERLLGLDRTYFVTSGSWKTGNPTLSTEYVGNVLPVQLTSFADPNAVRLVHVAVGKQLFDNSVEIVGGRLITGEDFASIQMACMSLNQAICANPIAGARTASFPTYANAAWGGAVKYKPGDAWLAQVGSYLVYPTLTSRTNYGVEFGAPEGSGALTIAQLTYAFGGSGVSLPGQYLVGGFYDSETLPRFGAAVGSQDDKTTGFWSAYLMGQQKVFSENGQDDQGLSVWAALSYAPPDKSLVEFMAAGGVFYRGPIPGRPHDGIAFTGSYASFSEGARGLLNFANKPGYKRFSNSPSFDTGEILLELNYRFTITPWFWIEPDVQGILQPSGSRGVEDAIVVGFALGFVL